MYCQIICIMELSLRTIDRSSEYELVPFPEKAETTWTEHKLSDSKYYQVSNLLTNGECMQILSNIRQYNHVNYSYEKRQSVREIVIDKKLSNILYDRLKSLLLMMNGLEPIGFLTAGTWKPVSINPCMRINKYMTPSIGFVPHFDGSYSKNYNRKSIFSVVIYLNSQYQGGKTILYDKLFTHNCLNMTTDEEIKLNGGITEYNKYFVKQTIGSAVIFNHNVLHSSSDMQKGTKEVLRTDIIFRRIKIQRCFFNRSHFDMCSEYFRKAQQFELNGDNISASKYYELVSSIRRFTRSNKMPVNFFTKDIWLCVIPFANNIDILAMRLVCKTLNDMLFDNKQDVQNYINKKIIRKFIPWYQGYEHLSSSKSPNYLFNDFEFFQENMKACLRVVAMYALINCSMQAYSNYYVVQYDPKTGTVLRCSQEWMLTAAFYNLPCYGQFYNCKCPSAKVSNYELFLDTVNTKQLPVHPGLTEVSLETKVLDVHHGCPEVRSDGDFMYTRCYKTYAYNNLIFDFSKNNVNIKSCTAHSKTEACYEVFFDKLNMKSFNHASCQCDSDVNSTDIDIYAINKITDKRICGMHLHVANSQVFVDYKYVIAF